MSIFDLTGQVAVVTGSTKGIGLGVVKQMAAHGAKVIVSSRKGQECEEVAQRINDEFGHGEIVAKGLACDINDLNSISRFSEEARQAWGRIDTVVCNAAILPFIGPPEATPPEDFDRILTSNIHNNFRLCAGFHDDLVKQGGGSMILIGSMVGHAPMPKTMAYALAKAGVSHLARCLAEEYAQDAIRVNCVAPGLIRSFSSSLNPTPWEKRAAGIPLKRVGEPEDIAGAVIFLASRAGSYVTGATILVDGGRVMLNPPGMPNPSAAVEGIKYD